MKRSELEHLILAAADISDDEEIVVVGSRATERADHAQITDSAMSTTCGRDARVHMTLDEGDRQGTLREGRSFSCVFSSSTTKSEFA
jgi:hypothetical protein